MRDLLLSASVLACPAGMALMMWFMGKGTRAAKRSPPNSPADATLAELRAQHRRLGAELERADSSNRAA